MNTHTNWERESADIASYPNRDLITTATEVFHVPDHLRAKFSKYYILHWSPDYLYSALVYGSVFREDIRYHVANMDRGAIAELHNEPQVRLSFRKLPDMEYGFVIVRRMPA